MIHKEQYQFINENGAGVQVYEFYGLSTETKPNSTIGSTFIECDTGKVYICDGSNGWTELGGN